MAFGYHYFIAVLKWRLWAALRSVLPSANVTEWTPVLLALVQKDLFSSREWCLGVQIDLSCHLLQRWPPLQTAAWSKAMPFPGWPTESTGIAKAQAFGTHMAQGNSDGSFNSGALRGWPRLSKHLDFSPAHSCSYPPFHRCYSQKPP